MPAPPAPFRRLVVTLNQPAPQRGLELAAALARLLSLELCGLVVEDEALVGLASLPFARELRVPGGWQPLDAACLAEELALATAARQRAFAAAARRVDLSCRVEVTRGTTSGVVTRFSRADDIVLVMAPELPAEQVSFPFAALAGAALASRAAVLLLPRRIARTTGPVVALAAPGDDAAVGVADAIAIAAGAPLRIVEVATGGWPGGADRLLGAPDERMVVMTRGRFAATVPAALAAARAVPVLVVEPEPATAAAPLAPAP